MQTAKLPIPNRLDRNSYKPLYPLIRIAIGNLLLGTYDDDLLGQQMILKQKERELSEIKKQIDAIEEVFNNSPFEFDKEKIKSSLNEKKEQLKRVLNTLKE